MAKDRPATLDDLLKQAKTTNRLLAAQLKAQMSQMDVIRLLSDSGLTARELEVLHDGRPVGRVTASAGVAAYPEHGIVPKALIEAADAAMYRAKKEGRDRVVVAGPQCVERQRNKVGTGKVPVQ